MRRRAACWTLAAVVGFGVVAAPGFRASGEQGVPPFPSSYRVAFTTPRADLTADLEGTERGDPKGQSAIPIEQWYSKKTRDRWGAWGPPARTYPAVPGLDDWPVERLRERAIAVGLRFEGYAYQHHHVPDWSPPEDWPWKPTAIGHNGPGLDCSNFTAFVYNLGFGLKITGDVQKQAALATASGPGPGRSSPIERIELPASYEERVRRLRTGDLVFIKSLKGEISHVVLWVGPIGVSSDETIPLVLDSHGEGVRDGRGRPIPSGIHLRPFREDSWYNRSAAHALRLLKSSARPGG